MNRLHAAWYGLLGAGLLGLSAGAAQANADVAVTKVETTPQPAVVSKHLVYSVTFTNNGPDPAPVQLFTHHDAHWVMRDINLYRANGAKYPNAQTTSPGEPYNDLETDVPSMAAGESLTLKVDVLPNATGTFEITARVTASAQDPDPSGNTATAEVKVQTTGPTNTLPELGTFGVAPSVIARPGSLLFVRPMQTVFASLTLAAKAKKATRVEIYQEGNSQPVASLLIPANKTAPTNTRNQPYPFPLIVPPGGRTTFRATLMGASASDSRYSREVSLLVLGSPSPLVVTGVGQGASPLVHDFQSQGSAATQSFLAFDSAFRGGVRVAVGDVTGEGQPDIVAGAGPGGGSRVKIFDGLSGAVIQDFTAFDEAFQGGVSVATGDVNGDGRAEVIVGAGAGGAPQVRVFDGRTGQLLAAYLAFPAAFKGGVNVATGDFNGDGIAEVVVGSASGASQVRVLNGMTGKQQLSFYPAGPKDQAGISVAVGDVNGDGRPEIITGSGAGVAPIVRIFDSSGKARGALLPYASTFTGGVTVAAADYDGDGRADVVTGPGAGGGPNVKVLNAADGSSLASFLAYDPAVQTGVFVAAGN